MERNGTWLNWAALIIGGLALVLALGGRSSQPTVQVQVPGGAVAGATRSGDAQSYGPGFGAEGRRGMDAASPHGYGRDHGMMGYHRPHFGPWNMIGGIVKFLGFLLIIGLVLRFIAGRRGPGGPPWSRGQGGAQAATPTEQTKQTEQTEGGSDETPPSTGETVRL